ncbi:hypothetical protein HY994_01490 [Candidatus Micrarchaeota archaeon]|nr:hypothetical protein [Candidatus Micrarchaeota archaeon]
MESVHPSVNAFMAEVRKKLEAHKKNGGDVIIGTRLDYNLDQNEFLAARETDVGMHLLVSHPEQLMQLLFPSQFQSSLRKKAEIAGNHGWGLQISTSRDRSKNSTRAVSKVTITGPNPSTLEKFRAELEKIFN